jgi:hypothetical protein
MRRMAKSLRHGGEDPKAEGMPQADRRRIGFDYRVELHRPVTVCTCLIKDMSAKGPSCAVAAARRVDDEPGVGDVCPGPEWLG